MATALSLATGAGPARARVSGVKPPAEAWHQQLLHLTEAHRYSQGEGVTVAVLDGAVAPHRDLAGALLPGVDLAPDPQHGGTAVAGLIAARGDGRTGLLGIAPRASILPVQVGEGANKADPAAVAKGVDWAVAHGATVIDLSYVRSEVTDDMRRAVRQAVAANAVVVAPASKLFPQIAGVAELPGVVSVGEADQKGQPVQYVAAGLDLDLVAPGEEVVSTLTTSLGDTHATFTGPQYATAIVAGVAALVRAKYPNLRADDVIRRLTTTSLAGRPQHDFTHGWGLVNPVAALTATLPDLPTAPTTGPTAGDPTAASTPRDRQWYLDALRVPLAHRLTRGRGVSIGLVANGTDGGGHPDLRGQVEQKGWVDGHGRFHTGPVADTYKEVAELDTIDHAGITGVMVAKGGPGLLGVAPEAKVLAVSQIGGDYGGAGVRWLADHGAKVILVVKDHPENADAIRYALRRDVVVVTAQPSHAALPGVVTVGEVGGNGTRSNGTTPAPTLTAPGRILVAGKDTKQATTGGYAYPLKFDTVAAAYVAGVAALVRARYPELTAASVINRLVGTATPVTTSGRQSGPDYGRGIIDPLNALTAEVPAVTANPLGDPGPPRSDGGARGVRDRLLLGAAALMVVLLLVAGAVVAVLVVRRTRSRPQRLECRVQPTPPDLGGPP
jgi:hypothetical protein